MHIKFSIFQTFINQKNRNMSNVNPHIENMQIKFSIFSNIYKLEKSEYA